MITTVSLLVVLLLILGAIYFRRATVTGRSARLCRLFRLNPDQYELLGSDLGGGRDKVYLRADGLVGVPDAVFRHRHSSRIVVGEAKRRRYSGRISPYERYQVLLYIGIAQRRFNADVHAVLRYGCGRCVSVEPDPTTYAYLLGLIPRFRAVAKRIGLWSWPRRRARA